jgi:hypothetical protein
VTHHPITTNPTSQSTHRLQHDSQTHHRSTSCPVRMNLARCRAVGLGFERLVWTARNEVVQT